MEALWPATTAIIGVYPDPPPAGSGIKATFVSRETADEQLWTKAAIKTARDLTRARDWVDEHLPWLP